MNETSVRVTVTIHILSHRLQRRTVGTLCCNTHTHTQGRKSSKSRKSLARMRRAATLYQGHSSLALDSSTSHFTQRRGALSSKQTENFNESHTFVFILIPRALEMNAECRIPHTHTMRKHFSPL